MPKFMCLLAWLALAAISTAAEAGKVKVGDSVTAGIHTEVELEARPFGYRVTWIEWDSHFREGDLRLGDKILGVNDYRYTRGDYKHHHAIGDYAESGYWEKQGAKDGEPVTLIVYRDGSETTVPGRLRANRFYYNDAGRHTMDLGGPERLSSETDENGRKLFDSAWTAWYESKTNGKPGSYPYILDDAWERTSFNNRKELEAHLGDKERIDYLVANYPCPFSEAMERDWERVRDYLEGEAVVLPANALDYRTRADRLRQEIKDSSAQAIAALEADLGESLEKSPSIGGSGLEAQREAYIGKIVYFDGLTYRNIINDLAQTFMVAGSQREGYFFLQADSPDMQRVFEALFRYRSLVNPKLAERFSVYIEVLDEPRIITFQGSPVMGLLGRVVAMAGGHQDVFVETRSGEDELHFAGEEETKIEPACAVVAGGAPEETVSCMVEAVKNGDRDTWQSMFAGWRFSPMGEGVPPLYDPDYRLRPMHYESAWEHSRKMIMGEVYDARVNRVGRVELLHQSEEDDSIPKVEAVRVILDHVGLIDGEQRTFVNLYVRRVWRLQRVDSGPWLIADVQHL